MNPTRTTTEIAAETADTINKASKAFVPAPIVRLAELAAEFQTAAAQELAELRGAVLAPADHPSAGV